MVRLAKRTVDMLKDDIVNILYESSLKPLFTNEIALLLRRDNEFTKKLLLELRSLGIVEEIKMNRRKKQYMLRKRWRISKEALKGLEKA